MNIEPNQAYTARNGEKVTITGPFIHKTKGIIDGFYMGTMNNRSLPYDSNGNFAILCNTIPESRHLHPETKQLIEHPFDIVS